MKQISALATIILFVIFSSQVTGQTPSNSHESQSADSDWKAFINWSSSPSKVRETNEVNSSEVPSTNKQGKIQAGKRAENKLKYSKERRRQLHLNMRKDSERWQRELIRKRESYHLRKAQRSQAFQSLTKEEQKVATEARKQIFRNTYVKSFRTDDNGNMLIRQRRKKLSGEALDKKRRRDRERLRKKRAEQNRQDEHPK